MQKKLSLDAKDIRELRPLIKLNNNFLNLVTLK